MTNKNRRREPFIKEGIVNLDLIARIQKQQHTEGTDTYNRYKKHWARHEELSDIKTKNTGRVIGGDYNGREEVNKQEDYEGELNDSSLDERSLYDAIDNMERNYARQNEYSIGNERLQSNHDDNNQDRDEIWVGIKFGEEDAYYRIGDIYGDIIGAEDFYLIKEDTEKYNEFELKCWSEIIGQDILSNEQLYEEIAELLEIEGEKVKGARVDSAYDPNIEEVIISFKAKISRGVY